MKGHRTESVSETTTSKAAPSYEANDSPALGTEKPDNTDWFAVVEKGRCDQCGYDGHPSDPQLSQITLAEVVRGGALLDNVRSDDILLRRRPEPATWSALEYAAHVRDTFVINAERIRRVLAEEIPILESWDGNAAARKERYNEQDPREVFFSMSTNAVEFASLLVGVRSHEWEQFGYREPNERFSVAMLGRWVLHETLHHRIDAERGTRG